jgi:glutaredoxin-related protein
MSIEDVIKDQVSKNKVVLYMKGSPDFPQCGFSANACNILRACGVEDFYTVNVLEDASTPIGRRYRSCMSTVSSSAARTS